MVEKSILAILELIHAHEKTNMIRLKRELLPWV